MTDRSAKRRKMTHGTIRATMGGDIYTGTSVKDILSKVSFFNLRLVWNPGNVLNTLPNDFRLWKFGVEGNNTIAFEFRSNFILWRGPDHKHFHLIFSEPFSGEDKSYVEDISRKYTQIVDQLEQVRDDLDAIMLRYENLLT